MDEKKKSSACVRECPCYPRCDEMMDQGQMPGKIPESWQRSQSQMMPGMGSGMQSGQMSGANSGAMQRGMLMNSGMLQPDMSRQGMMQQPNGSWPGMAQQPNGSWQGMTQQQGRSWQDTSQQPNQMLWQNRMSQPGNMSGSLMEEDEKDWQRLKELYPDMAKIILAEVEKACDKMEYEGSAMFDSMPDKTRVRGIADGILQTVSEQIPAGQVEEQADLYTMNREPCRNCRPNQNFLGDFIQVMLYQEMFHRRCRHRNCRRW